MSPDMETVGSVCDRDRAVDGWDAGLPIEVFSFSTATAPCNWVRIMYRTFNDFWGDSGSFRSRLQWPLKRVRVTGIRLYSSSESSGGVCRPTDGFMPIGGPTLWGNKAFNMAGTLGFGMSGLIGMSTALFC